MSRTYKKPYSKTKRFDTECRNHGRCPVCMGDRLHAVRTAEEEAKDQEKDYKDNGNDESKD